MFLPDKRVPWVEKTYLGSWKSLVQYEFLDTSFNLAYLTEPFDPSLHHEYFQGVCTWKALVSRLSPPDQNMYAISFTEVVAHLVLSHFTERYTLNSEAQVVSFLGMD